MKKLSLLSTAALIGLLAAPLQAGTEVYKQVAPPPPPPMYGLGFYGAIDAGANVYQNRGDTRTFTGDNRINVILRVDLQSGIKIPIGWVVNAVVTRKSSGVAAVLIDVGSHVDRTVKTESIHRRRWWRDLLIDLRSGLQRSRNESNQYSS